MARSRLETTSELDSEFGLEGPAGWTDAGNAINSVAPKPSRVVVNEKDQVARLGIAQRVRLLQPFSRFVCGVVPLR